MLRLPADFHSTGRHVLLWTAASAVVAKGGGSLSAFKISAGLCIGLSAWSALSAKDIYGVVRASAGLLLLLIWWPAAHLLGFWVFVLGFGDACAYRRFGWHAPSASLLLLWLAQCTERGSWTAVPMVAFPTFLALCLIFFFTSRRATTWLVGLCALATLGEIPLAGGVTQIFEDSSVSPPYRQGPVLAKIVGGMVRASGNTDGDPLIVRASHADEAIMWAQRKLIVLVEHEDRGSPSLPVIRGGEISQREPWSDNQFFGNQYLLAAVAQDGQWVSNLGGRLGKSGRLLLGSNTHRGGDSIEPLVISHRDRVYIQDSDPFVDRLSAYQPTAIREIVRGVIMFRLVNLGFAITSLAGTVWGTLAASGLFVTIVVWLALPQAGDVRISGRVCWPHEPAKLSGVLRSLVDAGQVMVRGDKHCRLLIVGDGRSETVRPGERLVLASPDSTIRVGRKSFHVDDLPLGDVDGVVDARTVSGHGCVTVVDGVTIIGTGSPSKQEWTKWLR
ncbi:MAG: hypothetical protein HY360_11880 [Verrucomicrobia bacterium]|nr:hypothetical protein [Verrucomicrobiota bacterium]